MESHRFAVNVMNASPFQPLFVGLDSAPPSLAKLMQIPPTHTLTLCGENLFQDILLSVSEPTAVRDDTTSGLRVCINIYVKDHR